MTVVLVTGGFDPVHSGHVDYFYAAKALGDKLWVGLNSDRWLTAKKGKPFMPWNEREAVVGNLKPVDFIFAFDDSDGSAKDAIRWARLYTNEKIIFANGGDRTSTNIPEMDAGVDNVEFVFGVGGENKKNSSSWILKKWNEE